MSAPDSGVQNGGGERQWRAEGRSGAKGAAAPANQLVSSAEVGIYPGHEPGICI